MEELEIGCSCHKCLRMMGSTSGETDHLSKTTNGHRMCLLSIIPLYGFFCSHKLDRKPKRWFFFRVACAHVNSLLTFVLFSFRLTLEERPLSMRLNFSIVSVYGFYWIKRIIMNLAMLFFWQPKLTPQWLAANQNSTFFKMQLDCTLRTMHMQLEDTTLAIWQLSKE